MLVNSLLSEPRYGLMSALCSADIECDLTQACYTLKLYRRCTNKAYQKAMLAARRGDWLLSQSE